MSATQTPEKKTSGGKRTSGKRSGVKSLPKLPLLIALAIVVLLGAVLAIRYWQSAKPPQIDNPEVARLAKVKMPSWINVDILPEDSDSRRGENLEEIGGIVIHYVGNPGSTAKQNRSYFGNAGTEVNAHFLVGLEGEIIQCLPLYEKSSASNNRNRDTISIEVCHPDESGAFNEKSYESLVRLTAWLCKEGNIKPEQVIRHYDVTGKLCPYNYVEHPENWEAFLQDVTKELK